MTPLLGYSKMPDELLLLTLSSVEELLTSKNNHLNTKLKVKLIFKFFRLKIF
jgi:hypothetical protein